MLESNIIKIFLKDYRMDIPNYSDKIKLEISKFCSGNIQNTVSHQPLKLKRKQPRRNSCSVVKPKISPISLNFKDVIRKQSLTPKLDDDISSRKSHWGKLQFSSKQKDDNKNDCLSETTKNQMSEIRPNQPPEIGQNPPVEIGKCRSPKVGQSRSSEIGQNLSPKIGQNRSFKIEHRNQIAETGAHHLPETTDPNELLEFGGNQSCDISPTPPKQAKLKEKATLAIVPTASELLHSPVIQTQSVRVKRLKLSASLCKDDTAEPSRSSSEAHIQDSSSPILRSSSFSKSPVIQSAPCSFVRKVSSLKMTRRRLFDDIDTENKTSTSKDDPLKQMSKLPCPNRKNDLDVNVSNPEVPNEPQLVNIDSHKTRLMECMKKKINPSLRSYHIVNAGKAVTLENSVVAGVNTQREVPVSELFHRKTSELSSVVIDNSSESLLGTGKGADSSLISIGSKSPNVSWFSYCCL